MANINTDANYSAGSYSNNENFTIAQGAKFTIDQSTVDIRYIRCLTFGELELKNTSTTQPIIVALGSTGGSPQIRMEGAGVVSTDSDWIVLGTGNGTAGQTFNVPLAQGVNGSGTQSCPDLGWLFVFGTDTFRDGSAAPRLTMQVDSDNYTNATTHERCGNVFTHDTTANTVTFKLAIPSGQEVRMPNIIMKSGATLSSAYFSLDANPNGVYNLDKTLWTGSFDFNFKSGKKQTIKNSGFKTDVARIFDLTSQVEAPEVENLGLYADLSMSAPYNISNSAAAGSHKNVWVDNPANLGAFHLINVANTSGAYLEMITATCYTAGTSSTTSNSQRGVINISSPDTTVYDLYNFSNHQSINAISGASNVIIDNIEFRPACRDDVANQLNIGLYRFAGSIGGATITNITTMPLANSYTYSNALTVLAGCKNITTSGITIRSGASGSGDNRVNNIVNDNANGSRYNDITVYGQTKARTVTHGANSLGCEISNLYFVDEQVDTTQADTVGARCRMEQFYMHANNVATAAIASAVDTLSLMMLRDTADGGTVEKTDGKFFLRMSPTDEETDYYTAVTQTGVIVFNNNNQLYIQNSGDIVELESFVHNNVSSISSNPALRGGGTGNFDVTVKMRRPAGTYTSYVALTQSAMQTAYATLASDAQNRVQFKFRIEKTATNLTDYLQDIAFNCTLTGDDYPFQLYPPKLLTLTGLETGSDVIIKNPNIQSDGVDNNVIYRANDIATTTAVWEYENAPSSTVDVEIYKAGFKMKALRGLSTASSQTLPATQDPDPVYV